MDRICKCLSANAREFPGVNPLGWLLISALESILAFKQKYSIKGQENGLWITEKNALEPTDTLTSFQYTTYSTVCLVEHYSLNALIISVPAKLINYLQVNVSVKEGELAVLPFFTVARCTTEKCKTYWDINPLVKVL